MGVSKKTKRKTKEKLLSREANAETLTNSCRWMHSTEDIQDIQVHIWTSSNGLMVEAERIKG